MKTSPLLDRYRGLVDESQIAAIYEVASSLHGLKVLHMNTTDRGGGVAEILHELLPVMEELGIRHDWKVIPLDEASDYFSARVVDMLQGYDMGEFPETEKMCFWRSYDQQFSAIRPICTSSTTFNSHHWRSCIPG